MGERGCQGADPRRDAAGGELRNGTDGPSSDHSRDCPHRGRACLAWLQRLGLGRLPGDIMVSRENFTFYLPITTMIIVSVVLSLILWLINR